MSMTNARPLRTLALAAALTAAAGTAMAQTPPPAPTAPPAPAAAPAPTAAPTPGAAQGTMTKAQVQVAIEAEGYTRVRDVEFDDGIWKADADSADGRDVDLEFDAATGTVYPDTAVSSLSEADIRARLDAAGYTRVRDVEFDDGVWKAEADNAAGQEMELRLDPADGRVIAEKRD